MLFARTGRTRARLLAPLIAVSAAGAVAASLTLLANTAQAATTSLCAEQTASVAGGAYIVENNEWNSSASECVSTDGGADFTVANSSISNGTSGAPGGYPAIYKGCHWGLCTTGSNLPIQVGSLAAGKVTTSWDTTQPASSGIHDVAYDIWFNQSPTTTGQPNAEELMVWLNHTGSVQPSGSVVASNVTIGGHTYNIWLGRESVWNDVSYVMTSGTTSVSNLDVDLLAADSVSRGYMTNSDYLIDVEAGFELWQGGAGLAANSFSVNVGGGSNPPPTTQPPTSAPPTSQPPTSQPPSSPASGRGCSAAYSVTSSWQGGFQAQVVVTNTGASPISAWQLGWTFPGDQKISNLWNGAYTQSGQSVTVKNAAYNGTIPAGGTAMVGFTATYASSNATPSGVTCSAS